MGAAAIGNTRLGSELDVLLGLGAAHGPDASTGALRRAVAFRRFRAADVRSILAAGAGIPQPRPPGDALILDLPVAPTRSLDATSGYFLMATDTRSGHFESVSCMHLGAPIDNAAPRNT